jgi:hypothetical protein
VIRYGYFPDKTFLTDTISVHIQGTIREYRPYFFWENPPRSLQIGEQEAVSLRLVNWDPEKPLPKREQLQGGTPEQMILEEQPLSESDQARGIILRLKVIPLGGQRFTLKAFRLQYEGFNLEVPGLSIPIIPKTRENPEKQREALTSSHQAEEEPPVVFPFPEIAAPIFPLFRTDYEQGLASARSFWNEGLIPEALAEMRRNERDNLTGSHFAALRQEAERILGLDLTQDEPWRPRKIALGIFLGSLSLLILTVILPLGKRRLFLSQGKSVTSRLSWGYKSIVIILMVLISSALFVLVRDHGRENGSAVLRATTAYRVPDAAGGASAYFGEGQPVSIHSVSDAWVYVESFDGRLGWVLRDKVIVY